jgi:deazaflavin-dependent oxidoreductase (nitroreductase family)
MTSRESLPHQTPEAKPLRVPGFVHAFNGIGRRLVSAGLLGPNVLLTVRGRKSGMPRSTPVALVEVGGRRWIIGTFGEVDWVRNLRAARQATITRKRRDEPVQATELSPTQGAAFFRDVLIPYATRLPVGRLLLRFLGAGDIETDPEGAARRRPVFELRPANAADQARSAEPASR